MKQHKTNAMRILDKAHIAYEEVHYDISDGNIDGTSVYQKVGLPPEQFYKTLVTRGKDGEILVFVIPVLSELDLKKAAKCINEKKVELLAVKELLPNTGYIRGGCSPIGMKKMYKTVINESISKQNIIYVSGGKQGLLIGLSPNNLIHITNGVAENIIQ